MNRFKTFARRLWASTTGSAAVEFALTAPILALVLTGTVELGHFLLLNLKSQHAAVSIADLATRDDELSEATLIDIFQAIPPIMEPIPVGEDSRIIVSGISKNLNEDPKIFWQRSGGGSLTTASTLGTAGQTVTPPAGLTMLDNETIIMAEFFYAYEPLFFPVINPQVIVKTSFFRPRLGSLQKLD